MSTRSSFTAVNTQMLTSLCATPCMHSLVIARRHFVPGLQVRGLPLRGLLTATGNKLAAKKNIPGSRKVTVIPSKRKTVERKKRNLHYKLRAFLRANEESLLGYRFNSSHTHIKSGYNVARPCIMAWKSGDGGCHVLRILRQTRADKYSNCDPGKKNNMRTCTYSHTTCLLNTICVHTFRLYIVH